MDNKEFYEKTEEFAKKIINLAAEEGLTVRKTTREELEKKHEEECPKYKLLSSITDLSCRACDRSLHASVVSIIAIILSAIAIILHFV